MTGELKSKLEMEIQSEFLKWEWTYEKGGYGIWSDGRILNSIRRRIAVLKEEVAEFGYHFDICDRELPPLMDEDYMVNVDKIRNAAKDVLGMYQGNDDYRYILAQEGFLDAWVKDKMRYPPDKIISKVKALESAVKNDKLTGMRKWVDVDKNRLLRELTACRKELEDELTDALPFN